jgi:hypothetical protein
MMFQPQLAGSCSRSGQIHYRIGPSIDRGSHNSVATAPDTDAEKDVLSIETRDGEQVPCNPVQLKQLCPNLGTGWR